MVPKRLILFTVEHFQHCSGWVTPEIIAHLINFIQQNQWILGLCPCHRIHNASRHCSDVSFPVSSNIRFIPNSAQRNPFVISAQSLGNGFSDGSLADTRRANKTENLSRHFRHHGMQSDALQYPFLDLFHTVMVFVQNGSCLF